MSAAPAEDLPDAAQVVSLPLRREALLPNERGRGLGTVAVVCTMAGVASGLALATTLMAMQVADSMSSRTPAYQIEVAPVIVPMAEHGYLGISQCVDPRTGDAIVQQVNAGTPADRVGLQVKDRIIAVNGAPLNARNEDDVVAVFANEAPGTMMTLTVERPDHTIRTVRPILAVRPADKPIGE